VHAVGPIWHGGGDQEETKLEKAVLNSLKKAEELQARSVALPAISSGIFGVPATLVVTFSYSLRPRAHGEHTLWRT
jgi:O-acetyl-ADP-ribose deacetylase (regulator of RNase III)